MCDKQETEELKLILLVDLLGFFRVYCIECNFDWHPTLKKLTKFLTLEHPPHRCSVCDLAH
jgi:hypothetical protein